jgi:hypothetical protein
MGQFAVAALYERRYKKANVTHYRLSRSLAWDQGLRIQDFGGRWLAWGIV